MGLLKPDEAEAAAASGSALRSVMSKKQSNEIATRSALPFDQAYAPENLPAAVYNKKVKEVKKKQADSEAEQKALAAAREAEANALEAKQTKVPIYDGVPNMQEAMNPTTQKNAYLRMKASDLRAGAKESVSGSKNNIMNSAEAMRIAGTVNDVSDLFNVDEFDKRTTIPELDALKKKYAEQITGLDQEQDKTADLVSILAASGKDPSKIDINKFYKFDAKDKAAALREKLRVLTNDQSKALGDTAKLKLGVFTAMKLPNTQFAESAGNAQTPAARGSGGGMKAPTDKENTGLADDVAAGDKLIKTRAQLTGLLHNLDPRAINIYSKSPTAASIYTFGKGMLPGEKKAAADTERAISLLAGLMADYQLKMSGKAASDKEAAKLMIVGGISAAGSKEGMQQAIMGIYNDFQTQIATRIASRNANVKAAFKKNAALTGFDPDTIVRQSFKDINTPYVPTKAPPKGGKSKVDVNSLTTEQLKKYVESGGKEY